LHAQNAFDEPDVVAPTHKVVEAETLSRYRFAARSATLLRWRI
jgi:hypothetical protein